MTPGSPAVDTSGEADEKDDKAMSAFETARMQASSATFSTPTPDQQKRLYGLLKQSMEGDCKEPEPEIMDETEQAKWTSWNTFKAMEPMSSSFFSLFPLTFYCR